MLPSPPPESLACFVVCDDHMCIYIYVYMYTVYIKKTTNVSWAEVETRILSKDNPAVFLKHMEVGSTRHGHFESTRIWYFPNKVPIGSMYGRFTMIYLFYLHLVDFVVNVDKYTIHGSYGIRLAFPAVFFHTLLPQNKYGTLKKKHDGWRLEEDFPADPTIHWCCLPLFVFKFFLFRVSQKTTKNPPPDPRPWFFKNRSTSPEVLTHEDSTKSPKETTWKFQKELYMGVSKNMGTPQIIHSNRIFHYKPFILGFPYFWKHPYTTSPPKENACTYLNPPFWNLQGVSQYTKERRDFFVCGEDGGFMGPWVDGFTHVIKVYPKFAQHDPQLLRYFWYTN